MSLCPKVLLPAGRARLLTCAFSTRTDRKGLPSKHVGSIHSSRAAHGQASIKHDKLRHHSSLGDRALLRALHLKRCDACVSSQQVRRRRMRQRNTRNAMHDVAHTKRAASYACREVPQSSMRGLPQHLSAWARHVNLEPCAAVPTRRTLPSTSPLQHRTYDQHRRAHRTTHYFGTWASALARSAMCFLRVS